jgi:cell division protein FtsW (lipid II flippase)
MKWYDHLLETTTFEIVIPALILLCVGLLLIYVLFSAQRRPDFDIAEFLKDDKGRYSALRAWGFICLGVHSWWVATLVFQKLSTENYFLYFGMIWAGTPILIKFAERWTGNLPFAQAGSTSPTTEVTVNPTTPAP